MIAIQHKNPEILEILSHERVSLPQTRNAEPKTRNSTNLCPDNNTFTDGLYKFCKSWSKELFVNQERENFKVFSIRRLRRFSQTQELGNRTANYANYANKMRAGETVRTDLFRQARKTEEEESKI